MSISSEEMPVSEAQASGTDLEQIQELERSYGALKQELGKVIIGQQDVVSELLIALFSGGNCLLVGVPGLAKTLLISTLSRIVSLEYSRIQFTPDLMPSDITGTEILEEDVGTGKRIFKFIKGPIFSNILLADEINRATPKTQSALLEAMEEKQITVEGATHRLDEPFFVIGTQNPLDQSGTFPLPESQLDRFMMKLSLGYPDQKAERALMSGGNPRELMRQLRPVISIERFLAIQAAVDNVHCSEPLLDYVQLLVQATRNPGLFVYGISPRAGLAIIRASKAWAIMDGRSHAEPGDVQAIFKAIVEHRLTPAEQHSRSTSDLVTDLVVQTPIP